MQISKQFVQVGARRVLVRYAGRGPAIVLLHQSPQNSSALIPWIERLASRYAVFAPDTPGFGDSDPLPLAQPEIPDYAAAVAALLDALGIGRAMVYGVHTGAVTALRLALDFPDKVAVLVCDGYARFGAADREALLANYLPPFEPSWDGTHLIWLFARLREQHLFFPWNDGSQAARLAYPLPGPEHIHNDVMHVLAAGDGYRVGYRAPFLYDDQTAAARLTPPAYIFYRAEDVLAPHLRRLPALPANVIAELVDGGPPALVVKADAAFSAHAKGATVIDSAACVDGARATTRALIALSEGELAYRLIPGNGMEVVVFLHDIGSPARIPVTRDHAATTLLPDLPGHGASREWSADRCVPDVIARALAALLDALGFEAIAIMAIGGSCPIAIALAHHIGTRCTKLTLQNAIALDVAERAQFLSLLPDLTPTSTGAQLLTAWNYARMKYLFWPWIPQDSRAVRQTMAPAPRRVHADAVEILRAGNCFRPLWREALTMDIARSINGIHCPVELLSADEPEPMRLAARLASAAGLAPVDAAAKNEGLKTWQK